MFCNSYVLIYNYKKLLKKYINDRKFIPENNLIEIKYENFVKEPIKTLEEIYAKFNLTSFEKSKSNFENYILKHKNYKTNNYSINKNIKDKIYNEWNFAFKEFGYSK